MKNRIDLLILALLMVFSACTPSVSDEQSATQENVSDFALDTMLWTDAARNREIPVAIYRPEPWRESTCSGVVLLSHGYGQNKGGDYLAYGYLAKHLALQGYLVASIQHELPDDSLLSMVEPVGLTRRSNWERGAANILFVLKELEAKFDFARQAEVTVIGHSNGGDMSVLFATEYPELVDNLVSLDNRRMPLPRTSKPRMLSLRSADMPADEGVLPTETEANLFDMQIIWLDSINHSDMDETGTDQQKAELNRLVSEFLKK